MAVPDPRYFLDVLLVVRCGAITLARPRLALVLSLSALRLGSRR